MNPEDCADSDLLEDKDLVEDEDEDEDDDDLADRMMDREFYGGDDDFACPGGASALRAASPSNPRDRPCPTCGRANVLTRKDVELSYQCDSCADTAEGYGP